jgi:hypothetical protein
MGGIGPGGVGGGGGCQALVQDCGETDLDCGGPAAVAAGRTCGLGKACLIPPDCDLGLGCEPGKKTCQPIAFCGDASNVDGTTKCSGQFTGIGFSLAGPSGGFPPLPPSCDTGSSPATCQLGCANLSNENPVDGCECDDARTDQLCDINKFPAAQTTPHVAILAIREGAPDALISLFPTLELSGVPQGFEAYPPYVELLEEDFVDGEIAADGQGRFHFFGTPSALPASGFSARGVPSSLFQTSFSHLPSWSNVDATASFEGGAIRLSFPSPGVRTATTVLSNTLLAAASDNAPSGYPPGFSNPRFPATAAQTNAGTVWIATTPSGPDDQLLMTIVVGVEAYVVNELPLVKQGSEPMLLPTKTGEPRLVYLDPGGVPRYLAPSNPALPLGGWKTSSFFSTADLGVGSFERFAVASVHLGGALGVGFVGVRAKVAGLDDLYVVVNADDTTLKPAPALVAGPILQVETTSRPPPIVVFANGNALETHVFASEGGTIRDVRCQGDAADACFGQVPRSLGLFRPKHLRAAVMPAISPQ